MSLLHSSLVSAPVVFCVLATSVWCQLHTTVLSESLDDDGAANEICESGWERLNKTCPTWTLPVSSDPECCKCGSLNEGGVQCDHNNISILSGHCMTYDSAENTTYIARCPYGLNISQQYLPLPHQISRLNSTMCGPLLREGRVCGECKPGYGPGVFSADVNCYRCSGLYHGWWLFLVFELVPLTLFFLVIMVIQSRETAGTQNAFLFFSQLITMVYQFYPPTGSHPFGQASSILIRFFLVVYGIFNLDYFRKVIPPFCVSENITGLPMISLLYIAVIYLVLLSVLAYVLIEMHAHNCRFLVWLWRPLHKYYVKVCRNVNPHTTLIDAFATLLILSYSRLMFVSFMLLRPVRLYTPDGSVAKQIVYFDGTIDYFSARHIPYVVLGSTVIMVFNVIPIVFLCIYPSKAFQKLLGKPCSNKIALVLRPFADAFQGCYKSGMDGKRDYRYFAGFYLFLRFVICFAHLVGGEVVVWLLPSLVFLITALLFANVRPYRKDIFNTIDSLWFTIGMMWTLCQAFIAARGVEKTLHYQMILQVLLSIPLVYVVCHVLCFHVAVFVTRRAQRRQRECATPITAGLPYRLLEETI